MSRINQNIPSLIAQRVLGNQNKGMAQSLQRLSTGYRINRGADDPAGLIASENLRAEKSAINSAITNSQRADQVVNVAEGGLQEVSNMLVELQGLVGATANEAGVSQEERDANQLQIDSILQTIDRIANATSFQGTKLLNGNFDYTVSGQDDAVLSDVTVNAAKLAADGTARTVTITVLQSAQTGAVFLSTGANFANGGSGEVSFEITGTKGVQQFTFASGTSQTDILAAVNSFKDSIGVSATVAANTSRISINSTGYGADSFVRVKELSNEGPTDFIFTASTAGGTAVSDLKDKGRNATVLINGTQATTDGLTARVSSDGFDVSISIDGTSTLNNTGQSTTFDITSGGANFNLAPSVNLASKVSLGIETVTTGNLGGNSFGFLSDLKSGGSANVQNGNLSKAQEVIDASIKQVSSLRGRLGAFQKNVVGSTISSLGIALENTTAAESAIRDTDFASETANMTRAQILSQAATQSLALANSAPQQVLSLLRG
ncbi:MAG: flagellin [Planctomycetota bacterium]|nr:MAG: flagellin [Planctomycetota bacterium]